MTSVSPAARALMTTSRSPMTATSAISGLATDTRLIAVDVSMGYERPTGRSTRRICWSGVCAAAGAAERTAAASATRTAALRRLREEPDKRLLLGKDRTGEGPAGRI